MQVHTLEEVLVDLLSVFLWNQHVELLVTSNSGYLEVRSLSKIFSFSLGSFFARAAWVQAHQERCLHNQQEYRGQ